MLHVMKSMQQVKETIRRRRDFIYVCQLTKI